MKKNYGVSADGNQMTKQKEVIKNWLLTHRGEAISQGLCTSLFGFTRLGAIIWVLYNKEGMPIKRERRNTPTRYDTISRPMFYWID